MYIYTVVVDKLYCSTTVPNLIVAQLHYLLIKISAYLMLLFWNIQYALQWDNNLFIC